MGIRASFYLFRKLTADLSEWIRYRIHLYKNEPYFGRILAASGMSHRRTPMQKLMELEVKNHTFFRILEIGSWAGASALLWAKAIKDSGIGGIVFCVDPWRPYMNQKNIGNIKIGKYQKIERALGEGKIYKLFLHNIKAAGYSDIIKPLRFSSDEILPVLRGGEFNLVYIDGDHSYSQVIKDLENCRRLLVGGGGYMRR